MRRLSAVAQLDRHPRLVLLGDPGSGKSTFVNFVALCLVGQALDDPAVNLAQLTTPLPKADGTDSKEPQPWSHGALLPIRVILRDSAARGLPKPGQAKAIPASCLWNFIVAELATVALEDYAPLLKESLRKGEVLVLLDGLDEVRRAGGGRRGQGRPG